MLYQFTLSESTKPFWIFVLAPSIHVATVIVETNYPSRNITGVAVYRDETRFIDAYQPEPVDLADECCKLHAERHGLNRSPAASGPEPSRGPSSASPRSPTEPMKG